MKLSQISNTKPPIKMFALGYSGMGKSSACYPLAIEGPISGCPVPGPGLELKILDFDTKAFEMATSVLRMMLDKKLITQDQFSAAADRIDIVECFDPLSNVQVVENKKTVAKLGIKGVANAWQKAVKQIGSWENSLTDRSVFIVDSLTHAARAAVAFTQELNNRQNLELTWTDYSSPQNLIMNLINLAAGLKSSVIFLAHQTPVDLYKTADRIDKDGEAVKDIMDTIVVPVSVGKAKAVELPSRFNHLVLFAEEGAGPSMSRYMYTTSRNGVTTKTPFFNAKPRYNLTTSMVEYFALR